MSWERIDKTSETWRTVSEWLDEAESERLRSLRSVFCEELKTQQLRGALSLIDEIRQLGITDG